MRLLYRAAAAGRCAGECALPQPMKPSVGCLRSRRALRRPLRRRQHGNAGPNYIACDGCRLRACMLGWWWQEYIRDQKRLQLRIAGAGRLQWSLIKSIKNSKASQSQAALVRQSAIAVPPAAPLALHHLCAATPLAHSLFRLTAQSKADR
jgi:hypothetical protein